MRIIQRILLPRRCVSNTGKHFAHNSEFGSYSNQCSFSRSRLAAGTIFFPRNLLASPLLLKGPGLDERLVWHIYNGEHNRLDFRAGIKRNLRLRQIKRGSRRWRLFYNAAQPRNLSYGSFKQNTGYTIVSRRNIVYVADDCTIKSRDTSVARVVHDV